MSYDRLKCNVFIFRNYSGDVKLSIFYYFFDSKGCDFFNITLACWIKAFELLFSIICEKKRLQHNNKRVIWGKENRLQFLEVKSYLNIFGNCLLVINIIHVHYYNTLLHVYIIMCIRDKFNIMLVFFKLTIKLIEYNIIVSLIHNCRTLTIIR